MATNDPDALGYTSAVYRRVEDLAEIADYTPRGPGHDAAVDQYVQALHAICAQRTQQQRPTNTVPIGQTRVNNPRTTRHLRPVDRQTKRTA